MQINVWPGVDALVGDVARTVLVYVFSVLALRITGRRTLAHMSAFDAVITIAIGTLAASVALPAEPTLMDGAAVLLTLLGLQIAVGALRQRFSLVERILDFRPATLIRSGRVDLPRSPWTAQITVGDVESRLRQAGIGSIGEVTCAVLEPTGVVSSTTDETEGPLFAKVE